MAIGERASVSSPPYRANAASPSSPRVRRSNRGPLLRTLAALPLVAAGFVAIPSLVLGLQNGIARDHGDYVVGALGRAEDLLAWMFLATVPFLAFTVRRTCRTFSAPRSTKRRYTKRALLFHATIVALGLCLTRGLSPRSSLVLLAAAARPDGRLALVYRVPWGCSYELRAGDRPGMVKLVTVVGPFACDEPPPSVLWSGNDLTLVAANGETVGTWPADH